MGQVYVKGHRRGKSAVKPHTRSLIRIYKSTGIKMHTSFTDKLKEKYQTGYRARGAGGRGYDFTGFKLRTVRRAYGKHPYRP